MSTKLLETLLDLAGYPGREIPERPLRLARLSLYDWVLCGLAGQEERVAGLARELARSEDSAPIASLFGGGRAAPRMAALVNGTTSHALDFDDTHFAHIGHLSVGIYPAALAVCEETNAILQDLIAAFLLGAEAAIRMGTALGAQHYNRGFHQTATAGAFGACVAAARLHGLDRKQTSAALSLCATRASGLKSQFGTMGKPYNAGIAASNGVEAVKLAQLGFSAPDDGLAGPQGFVPTHSDDPAWTIQPADRWLFEDISYKFHACCHGTHAMIEALLQARKGRDFSLNDVRSCRIRTSPRWMSVCNIKAPKTGLEVKFSYRWLAAMVLSDMPTGSVNVYSDSLAADQHIAEFSKRVAVDPVTSVGEMQCECELVLLDGERINTQFDLAIALSPEETETKLRNKAKEILGGHAKMLDPVLDDRLALNARDIGDILQRATAAHISGPI